MSARFWNDVYFGYMAGVTLACYLGGLCLFVGFVVGIMAKAHRIPDTAPETASQLRRLSKAVIIAHMLIGSVFLLLYLQDRTFKYVNNLSLLLVALVAIAGLTIGFWPLADAVKNREYKPALKFFALTFLVPGVIIFLVWLIHSPFATWVD